MAVPAEWAVEQAAVAVRDVEDEGFLVPIVQVDEISVPEAEVLPALGVGGEVLCRRGIVAAEQVDGEPVVRDEPYEVWRSGGAALAGEAEVTGSRRLG